VPLALQYLINLCAVRLVVHTFFSQVITNNYLTDVLEVPLDKAKTGFIRNMPRANQREGSGNLPAHRRLGGYGKFETSGMNVSHAELCAESMVPGCLEALSYPSQLTDGTR